MTALRVAAAPSVVVDDRLDGVPVRVREGDEKTSPLVAARPSGPTPAQLRALAIGTHVPVTLAGRYRVERCIGRGGMATVFSGCQVGLDRPVAIKVLDDVRGLRDDGFARFVTEARTTAQLRHPGVVEILDFGTTEEGVVYLVMELLDGADLREIIHSEGPLSWSRARELMLQLCGALTAVHAAGFVHRDLKPANCFWAWEGEQHRLKLLDFGIVGRARWAAPRENEDRRERLTQAGRVVGTPEYMSPEQGRGEALDGRSDVYAAGLILGELLTGRVPFGGNGASAVIDAQIHDAPPRLSEMAPAGVQIDPAVEAIYARAIAKDPAERFGSAAALADAIEAVPDARPAPARLTRIERWRRVSRRFVAAAAL